MSRYGVSTIMNPKDLNEEIFQGCIKLSLHAIGRKGVIREDTFIINTSNGLWGDGRKSSSDKYEDFEPIECFNEHVGTNNYPLESPHYHLHVSVKID